MAGGADVCADCDAPNPRWASVNRGVLLCDDCSSVHRQLGRHISQVKHLTKSRWRPSQLAMVRHLHAGGANKYWEHILLEPGPAAPSRGSSHMSASRKPGPRDPVHPTKTEFIREKYLFLAFFKRPRSTKQEDLDQQLHASVRTGVLETSVYLLALGANPNYMHPGRGTTPLHVASQYNQVGQVELLLTYGADVTSRDFHGNTPLQVAQISAHHAASMDGGSSVTWSALMDCLVQAHYEITDSLSYFLCHQVPDHRTSKEHFLVPRLALVNSEDIVEARRKLQHLSNSAFSDLCIDVYDEVDRRETNQIRQKVLGNLADELCLFFLPPNREYSSTRNQGRQKLGRLSDTEFNVLTLDVLIEAKYRMEATEMGNGPPQVVMRPSHVVHHASVTGRFSMQVSPGSMGVSDLLSGSSNLNLPPSVVGKSRTGHRGSLPGLPATNDDPVYDQVAGDSEYACVLDLAPSSRHELHPKPSAGPPPAPLPTRKSLHLDDKPPTTPTSAAPPIGPRISQPPLPAVPPVPLACMEEEDRTELLNRMDDLEGRNKILEQRNKELVDKVQRLERQLETLQGEKAALLNAMTAAVHTNGGGNAVSRTDNASVIPVQHFFSATPGDKPSPEVMPRQNSSVTSTPLSVFGNTPSPDVPPRQESPMASTPISAPGNRSSPDVQPRPSSRQQQQHRESPVSNRSAGRQNYAMGSECFSSGLLMRQEILRGSPHAHERPRSTQSPVPLQGSGKAGRHKTPDKSGKSGSVDSLSEYSEPNATGCSSPVPSVSTATPTVTSPVCPPSEPLERDYDSPPVEKEEEALPGPEKVVRGVEAVTVHIRSLLEAANAKRSKEFPHCSGQIQSSVQALVEVFPSGARRQAQVRDPLRSLLMHARELRRHCDSQPIQPGGEELTRLIHHAHEIAKAAKQLLTHFQRGGSHRSLT